MEWQWDHQGCEGTPRHAPAIAAHASKRARGRVRDLVVGITTNSHEERLESSADDDQSTDGPRDRRPVTSQHVTPRLCAWGCWCRQGCPWRACRPCGSWRCAWGCPGATPARAPASARRPDPQCQCGPPADAGSAAGGKRGAKVGMRGGKREALVGMRVASWYTMLAVAGECKCRACRPSPA